jgi:hypothetical protein
MVAPFFQRVREKDGRRVRVASTTATTTTTTTAALMGSKSFHIMPGSNTQKALFAT